MKKICFFNLKGGCGKTTSAFNIGYYLAAENKKILFVDCDIQGNLTNSLIDEDNELNNVYDLLTREKDINKVIHKVNDNIDLIPSSIKMSSIEIKLSHLPRKEYILKYLFKNNLDKLNYDYIILDCPPSFNLVTINILLSCDKIFVPVQTEHYSTKGIEILLDTISDVNESLGTDIEVTNIFATLYDKRNNISKQQYFEMTEKFDGLLIESVIRKNVSLIESPSKKKSIFDYKPKSVGAVDYANLVEELKGKKVL